MKHFSLRLVAAALLLSLGTIRANAATDIAVCGESAGYGYYPMIGLLAGNADAGRWVDDAITGGRLTLVLDSDGNLDLLIADATGSIFSAKGDGATIIVVGRTSTALSIVVAYPLLTETYTFLLSETGPEVIWTANKFNTPILKVAAFRAPCSYLSWG